MDDEKKRLHKEGILRRDANVKTVFFLSMEAEAEIMKRVRNESLIKNLKYTDCIFILFSS